MLVVFEPMLDRYGILVQNQVGYHPILLFKTRWVPSRKILKMIHACWGINLVGTCAFRIMIYKKIKY
jgi:hypothetical protein